MLLNLYIKNFILIEEINLTLSDHFNVFTGETGAGKSLFVDALNFVSGERSTSQIVGLHGDASIVEAVFMFKKSDPVTQLLQEMGFDIDSEDVTVFSREMNRSGRSIARINRRVVTLKEIRSVLSLVIDIHSQHDTHALLSARNHLNLLQSYMNDDTYLNQYKETYKEYTNKLKEIDLLNSSVLDADALAFSKFLLKDIETLNPTQEDYDSLDESLKHLENYERNKQDLNTIESALSRDLNIMGSLHELLPLFDNIESLKEQYHDLYYQFEDISHEISHMNDNFIFDEYEFERMNKRMLQYTKMIRKHGTIESLLSKKEELETQIRKAEHYEDFKTDLQNELKEIQLRLENDANKLSQQRQDAAKLLEKDIIKELKDLSLNNAVFEVHFNQIDFNKEGFDQVQFMISMNKGMPVAELSKVASGGELSRVMLGLKVVFSKVQSISTLIFDEIDTGVSGTVAFKIGQKMRQISKEKQVISITHLPAVAVCATDHYLISKEDTDNTSITHVNLMSDEEKEAHLAIMMMGILNEDSINAARKLIEEGKAV